MSTRCDASDGARDVYSEAIFCFPTSEQTIVIKSAVYIGGVIFIGMVLFLTSLTLSPESEGRPQTGAVSEFRAGPDR